MDYLAHISEDGTREQTVKEHLEGTALLARKFADDFGYGDWGYFCGLLHDIGKYSDRFQMRIRGGAASVDHATAGAQLCFRLAKERGGFYLAPAYCIAGHHAGLPDTGTSGDTGDRGTFCGRMKKRTEDFGAYQEEIVVPPISPPVFQKGKSKDPTWDMSFLIRMLYSCLVDADYLDTEDFMEKGAVGRTGGEEIPRLLEKFHSHVRKWLTNVDTGTINGRRTEILRACMAKGEKEKGLFRLTVPTGGGKTISSLGFALSHAVKHGMKRVIYVIPYTSIIEQNAKVFGRILGEENILEHHCGMDHEGHEEFRAKQLAAENWDLPVVVTTNVQFFESLYSSRSSKCRKLHNIANSVIIFDEAQMLPTEYLLPCVAAMETLIRGYGCSVLLCTATQPALQGFFSSGLQYTELCPRMEEQFQFFKRVSFKNLGKITGEELLERLKTEEQALCILNTRGSVQRIYKEMEGEGVYHLSTFLYPRHRLEQLQDIRERLKAGKKCMVIATSLVEAGVDLDFQTVYRELAGVDSMIQAAGRCNREGKREVQESCVFYFQMEGAGKNPVQEQQIDVAKQILRRYDDISSMEAVQEYFSRLYRFQGRGLDKKDILGRFQKGQFGFASVGREFRLIEQNTRTLLIPLEDRAKEIAEEIRVKGPTKKLLREAGQYSVNIYDNVFQKLSGAGMIAGISEELKEDFFILRDGRQYSEKTGLDPEVELGTGIWF
ncbi:MAG: CRISPR-associated helicase Cas3' [Eubacteriales bacterium]|nr:CRISPR-associated helicase Cas3' [Eubacteriales bacterium]